MRPADEPGGGQEPPSAIIPVPEIRDYQKINAQLVSLLGQGHRRILLAGSGRQRLLASGLCGAWIATIMVDGPTGPEFAAGLDASGLTLIARGPSGDGVGSGLRAGRVIILGDAGDAAGYAQRGGLLVIAGSAGHRAGLAQEGGTLAILGDAGRLAADRQSGGRIFLPTGIPSPHLGRGKRGGEVFEHFEGESLTGENAAAWRSVLRLVDGLVEAGSFAPRPRSFEG